MILGKLKIVAVKGFDKEDKEDFEKEVAVQRFVIAPGALQSANRPAKCGIPVF